MSLPSALQAVKTAFNEAIERYIAAHLMSHPVIEHYRGGLRARVRLGDGRCRTFSAVMVERDGKHIYEIVQEDGVAPDA